MMHEKMHEKMMKVAGVIKAKAPRIIKMAIIAVAAIMLMALLMGK